MLTITPTIAPTIELTESQTLAKATIEEWLESGATFAVLTGYAGTGKTTVLQQIVKQVIDTRSVAMASPTHKATSVLRRMSAEWGINVQCVTVHQLLGLKPRVINAETGEQKFIPDPGVIPKVDQFSLIIIDECSMIGTDLFEHIYNAVVESADIFHSAQVLFVGDPAQLNPVNESASPSFDVNGVQVSLTEIVRYSGAIAHLAEDVRINNRRVKFPRFEMMRDDNSNGIYAYQANQSAQWQRQLIRAFEKSIEINSPDFVRVLAYTNTRVVELNSIIKHAIHGDDCPRFFPGQRLMANSPIMDGSKTLIPNSAEFTIITADKTTFPCRGEQWEGWRLTTDFEGLKEVRVLAKTKEPALRQALASLKRDKRWKEFYRLLQYWHDVRDVFALTVHKSQGSTFSNVFLDADNLRICRKTAERNALLYVALTRASQRVMVLGGEA